MAEKLEKLKRLEQFEGQYQSHIRMLRRKEMLSTCINQTFFIRVLDDEQFKFDTIQTHLGFDSQVKILYTIIN